MRDGPEDRFLSEGVREGVTPPAPDLSRVEPYIRSWVARLPLREQGTLMAGIRGCDTVSNHYEYVGSGPDGYWASVDHPTKVIVRMIRYSVGNCADHREVSTVGAFMADWRVEGFVPEKWPVKSLDNLPLHFGMHMLHAVEVMGYRHPDPEERGMWHRLYLRIVEHLHLKPETDQEMIGRFAEDRIALGTVVMRYDRGATFSRGD